MLAQSNDDWALACEQPKNFKDFSWESWVL